MEILYRLEFSEEQQLFHLANKSTSTPNTHGWITINDNCSDVEFRIFESFVNRVKKNKLTNEFVKQQLVELNGFYNNISEYRIDNISITPKP